MVRALSSGWVAPLGPEVDAFEQELASLTGRQHAVALSSGTAALHLGLLNLGAAPGKVVITSTMTFAATVNAVLYTGATPVFVDCDDTGTMDVDLLEQAVAGQRRVGNPVAAIMPVDILGQVAPYALIDPVATASSIPVLSDAAESLGASRGGAPAGSFGRLAAVSFNGNKVMTTSGGGALLTDDGDAAQRTRYLATQAREPAAHYEHLEVGYNYRLSNLLAALGRAQLGRLELMVSRRRELRRHYRALFEDVRGVRVLGTAPADREDNCWLTSILVEPDEAGWDAESLRAYLGRAEIEARPLWKPMHAQPVFRRHQSYLNGTSDWLFARGLSLPSGSALTPAQVDRVSNTIRDFLDEKTSWKRGFERWLP